MTLATILSVCIFCSAATAWASSQDVPPSSQSAPATPTTPPSSASPSAQVTTGQQKAKAAKRKRHKKTAKASTNSQANCTPTGTRDTSANGAATTAGSPTPKGPARGTSSSAASGNSTPAPTNCPPEKKIVHDGGTTEPAVQLLGGPVGPQASHQRDTTDQLLGSVENNLKQVAGRQLSSSQQEMVNQIQQFMEQSKAAVAAGDVERGHNLALKAHLLSAELVKP